MRPIDADFLKNQIKDIAFKCRKMIWSGGELYEECLRVVEKMIDDAPTIDEPSNDPLTISELREMDGEPVWIVSTRGSGWCIVNWLGINQSWMYYSRTGTAEGMTATPISARDYGDTWLAYRRKPEE